MTGQTCALPGCCKALWPSAPGVAPNLACGNLHHQLLMAGRFNPVPPHPYQAIQDRNEAGLCALLSCEKPPYSGHSWCSRTHYLLWLTEFTSSLHPDQICMLPGCTRHVFVDDNARPPSRFCGWRHQQKFVMLRALQHRQQEPLPSMECRPQELPLSAPLNETLQSECGHLPSLNSLMYSLKQSAIVPENIRVIEDFYEKHPWEVLTEGHACWLIALLKFTSKGRKLTTKGNFHWKQSGRPDKMTKYIVKYYTYTKRKGKEKESDQQHTECLYTMKEYTMEDVKLYSLIRLVKDKPSSNGKLRKEQPRKPSSNGIQIVDQFDNASSEDTITSEIALWMQVDSYFSDLPPLDDSTQVS